LIESVQDALQPSGKRLLIIVEDLDKLSIAGARRVFIENSNLLTVLRSNIIYTIPIFTFYSPDASWCKSVSVNCLSSLHPSPSGVRRSEPSAAEPRRGGGAGKEDNLQNQIYTSHLHSAFANYRLLLEELSFTPEQISKKLADLGKETGYDEKSFVQLMRQLFQDPKAPVVPERALAINQSGGDGSNRSNS
jgi:hypothetical protein